MPLDVIYLVDNRQLVLINLFKLNPIALEYEPESEDVGEMEETGTGNVRNFFFGIIIKDLYFNLDQHMTPPKKPQHAKVN